MFISKISWKLIKEYFLASLIAIVFILVALMLLQSFINTILDGKDQLIYNILLYSFIVETTLSVLSFSYCSALGNANSEAHKLSLAAGKDFAKASITALSALIITYLGFNEKVVYSVIIAIFESNIISTIASKIILSILGIVLFLSTLSNLIYFFKAAVRTWKFLK